MLLGLGFRDLDFGAEWTKSGSKVDNGLIKTRFKAWQISLTLSHHMNEYHNLFVIMTKCHEALYHSLSEPLKPSTINATHELHHIFCQLKWCTLSIDHSCPKHETKIDMKDTAVNHIDHNVGIVSIFNLEDVAD